MIRRAGWLVVLIGLVVVATAPAGRADEGMWLFNDLPKERLQEVYGFTPTDEWTDHVMKSSVRFNVGGSASFVSSTGLVLTNHHVGSDTIQKLSTPEHNYYRDGFLARSQEEELLAPDLELNQLVEIEDVTSRVAAAVPVGTPAAEGFAKRRAVIAEIEKEGSDATGLRCNVVTLYGGARYHLYKYKRYTDVRLVWAPEFAAGFFGGDADNFEYPRYNLDCCLFRVYEDGKPAQIEHFLRWSDEGAKEGELIFVSGNPGRTSRIFTVSALKFQRDRRLPTTLNALRRREVLMQQFGTQSPEHARRAADELFGAQNSRKAYLGMLDGLQDPMYFDQKEAAEARLLETIRANPQLAGYAGAWDRIAEVQTMRAEQMRENIMFGGQLFNLALTLVQMAAEDQKPNEQRLEEFRQSNRESLTQELVSEAPIYLDLEQTILADTIARALEIRGADDSFMRQVLAGQSPKERTAQLIIGTKLADPAFRRQLVEGGASAIASAQDPLLDFARQVDPEVRRLRALDDEISERERQAYGQIAEVLFAVQGDSTYPDATFSPRLAFGVVTGYQEAGQEIAPWTTIAGAFEHESLHEGREPWVLPPSWHEAKSELDLTTPLNFVCTADIIGGNSGSPVINRNAEIVGLIFDGNIQSLTANYYYSDQQARAVAVHTGGIREALRVIYDAPELADELGK